MVIFSLSAELVIGRSISVIIGLEGLPILLVEWDLWNDTSVKGLSVLNAGFHYFLGAYQV